MPQLYKVTKAFLSTEKDSKEPQVIQTQGGPAHKFMVQVANQPVDGWFSILKKPGNEVKEGDEIYGEITENQWGKPNFKRMQNPNEGFGGQRQSAPSTPSTSSQPSGSLEEKVDYLISLVENFLDTKQSTGKAQAGADFVPKDTPDGPVDLSSLDY